MLVLKHFHDVCYLGFFQAGGLSYAGTQIGYMFWCKHSRIIKRVILEMIFTP